MKTVISFFVILAFTINSKATHHQILVDGCAFTPSVLNVTIGDTVIWILDAQDTRATTSLMIPPGADSWNEMLNEENPTFTYVFQVPGDYTYKSAVLPTCIAVIHASTVNSLDEIKTEGEIKVYPNPATNELNIEIDNDEIINYAIVDLTGKEVNLNYCKFVKKQVINISDLAAGEYLIFFFKKDGLFERKKLMVIK